ncbi:MAG: sodium:proton antiporter, partial [Byssovorax sp.]
DAEEKLRSPAADEARDPVVERALLHAQKSALLDAARRGLVGSDAVEVQVADLDRALMAISHDEKGEH